MSFLTNLFNKDEKILKQYNSKVQSILELEPKFRDFKEEDFKNKTLEFKERLKNGETLDDILVEAFALARQACKNVINEFPYPCQLVGGIALHEGNIAEMKTGEGKTLTSVMPVYLNALAGNGVHVVTVNEYLAKRDSEWMGQIHRYLGLTVGYNTRSLSQDEKRAAYACDITYSVNTELAFDYLRDNMVIEKEQRVLRGLNFALVDEVDSILIDEARTPLIISGGKSIPVSDYKDADRFVKGLIRGKDIEDKGRDLTSVFGSDEDEEEETGDYSINIKSRSIQLTANGISKAEKFYHVKNLYDQENEDKVHYINQALRARYIMQRDVDYVVDTALENKQRIQKIVIIDQNTGRKMEGREYSDGLHQAIEAKENVPITHETSTIAVISYQNFFRLYEKLCGMTGTAKTEEEEFLEIYNMRVISIPTNKDVIRIDEDDCIYVSQKAKFDALINEVKELYEKGQPVLVGTISVDVSEKISSRLKQLRIKHEVLNAKNHAREAEIIANAGQVGTVTIATNMAGRGTDIKLSPEAKELGGLVVLGSERHESRRIDNQLRGRSGRQGDPGRSKFFVSFEDDLMKRFGASNIKMLLERLPEETKNQPITAGALTKAIGAAQKRIEDLNFDARKNLLDFDNVLAQQRETMYEQRNYIIDNDDIRSYTKGQFEYFIKSVYEKILRENENNKSFDAKKAIINYSRNLLIGNHSMFISHVINNYIKDSKNNFPMIRIRHKTTNEQVAQYEIKKLEKDKVAQAIGRISLNIAANDSNIKPLLSDSVFDGLNEEETIKQTASILFDFYDKYAILDEAANKRTDNIYILHTIDSLWSSQIDTMNRLRENIQFRGYAQNNPLQAYTEEGYDLFSNMISNISNGIVNDCLRYAFNKIISNYFFDSKTIDNILYITVSEGKQ